MNLNNLFLMPIICIGLILSNNSAFPLEPKDEFKVTGDCNSILENIKAHLLGSQNDTLRKENLKDGLTLKLSDTSYTVLSFNAAITGIHYYVVKSNGHKLTSRETKEILTQNPKMLFIDDIRVMKKDTCYILKSAFVCKVID